MREVMKQTYVLEGLDEIDIDKIHEKGAEVLQKASLKEMDFAEPKGPYSEGSVRRDVAETQAREKRWRHEDSPITAANKKLATIFEAIIFQHAELSEWLGGNAVTLKTSKFDDYENGVDAVVDFQTPDSSSYLGLAMDVTFSSDPNSSDGMTKKFDRIFSRIEKGSLTKIKYFHAKNANMSIHGQLNDVPEVVIGADKGTVLELAELWNARQNDILAEHKIQIMILQQMEAQLRVFSLYALKHNRKNIASIFQKRLEIIVKILEGKKDLAVKVSPGLANDQVHYSMMTFLKHKGAAIDNMEQIQAAA